ncbi:MAG: hypothetical protein J6T46_06180, partial [Victivallales bacterium]|nr:hypothetical protein [Victivallales bacterium]
MLTKPILIGHRGFCGSYPENTLISFEKAIGKPGMSFICECKKASPSRGLITEDFPYLQIAKEYEA